MNSITKKIRTEQKSGIEHCECSLKTDPKRLNGSVKYYMKAVLFLMSFFECYINWVLFAFSWQKETHGFGNTSYLNTPCPQSDLLAPICAVLDVSAPTPAIRGNQPSTHCIIIRWGVSVARITLCLFTGETWMQKLCRHGESKVTEL